eukprot:gene4253-3075_t
MDAAPESYPRRRLAVHKWCQSLSLSEVFGWFVRGVSFRFPIKHTCKSRGIKKKKIVSVTKMKRLTLRHNPLLYNHVDQCAGSPGVLAAPRMGMRRSTNCQRRQIAHPVSARGPYVTVLFTLTLFVCLHCIFIFIALVGPVAGQRQPYILPTI